MSQTTWTLATLDPDNGYAVVEEKTIADWRLSNLRRTLYSQAADQLSMHQTVASYTGEPLFPVGTVVRLKRDGVGWFFGRVVDIQRSAGAEDESISYTVAGPWWYLANIVYQQQWQFDDGQGKLAAQLKSRAILCQGLDGARMNTGQQISAAISYAQSCGAPVALGATVPPLTIFFTEMKDAFCADIIKQMLRWTPDAVTWFDYSQEIPVLHTARRSQLQGVSLPSMGAPISALQIAPIYDRLVPSVVIHYERTHTSNGSQYAELVNDIAPQGANGQEIGALVMTIDLQGSDVTSESQRVQSRELNTQSIAFWRRFFPELPTSGVTFLNVSETADDGKQYDYYLTDGAVPSWMGEDTSNVSCKADAYWEEEGSDGKIYVRKELNTSVTGVNLSSGTYTRLVSFTEAEPIPQGLAGALYEALGTLEYAGTLQLIETEAGSRQLMGRCLNLTGGRPEWASMRALIQSVTEDVDMGQTQITFGAGEHLGIQDRIELLRASRADRRTIMAPQRTSGKASSASQSNGPAGSANNTPSKSDKTILLSAEGGAQISLDPDDVDNAAGTARMRPETVYENGEVKQAYYLRSEGAVT